MGVAHRPGHVDDHGDGVRTPVHDHRADPHLGAGSQLESVACVGLDKVRLLRKACRKCKFTSKLQKKKANTYPVIF